MIRRYVVTLAIAVCLVTLAVSAMPFAMNSCVLSGQAVNEDLRIEMTFDADSDHTYRVTPETAQSLQENVHFLADGSARVLSVNTQIEPKSVSWKDGNTNKTAPGAVMTTQLRWDTPADAKDGATGSIYLEFPTFEGTVPTFHSGQYQILGNKRCVIRELIVYRSPFQLYLARFGYALVAGLPFGILLHTIGWAFVLKREKRSRIENLPTQGRGFPQTFFANPVAEWIIWLIVLGIGSGVSCIAAGVSISDNFVGSTVVWVIYGIVAVVIVVALISVYFTGRSVLTVHVDAHGISYSRGRNNPQWITAAWSDTLTIVEKYRKYRGNTYHWIEVEFKDDRKTLKIPTSTVGYPTLRHLLFGEANS